jgi:hypothetical protein
MERMNPQELLHYFRFAGMVLDCFFTLGDHSTSEQLVQGLTSVSECIQTMQPVVREAMLRQDDADVAQGFDGYRLRLEKLQQAYEDIKPVLLRRREELRLRLESLRAGSSWMSAVKSAQDQPAIAAALSVRG